MPFDDGGSDLGKKWLQSTWNEIALNRAREFSQAVGRPLPCHVVSVMGSIVEVSFAINAAPYTLPNALMPKAESQWIRFPIEVGEYGVAVPAGFSLDGIDGLGGGTADLSLPANLAALWFVPIGSKSFPSVDTTKAFVSGQTGVVLQDGGANCVFILTATGITITVGGKTWTWNASGLSIDGYVQATGEMTAGHGGSDSVGVQTHTHSGIQTGSSNTNSPNAGT